MASACREESMPFKTSGSRVVERIRVERAHGKVRGSSALMLMLVPNEKKKKSIKEKDLRTFELSGVS